jgi:hypothetical protein
LDGPYDTFLDLYDSLREVFSDDPGELIRSEQISTDADRIVWDIYALTHRSRIHETFGGRRKSVDYVPARFRGVWSDYLKRWSTFVDYYVERNQAGNDDFMFPPIEYPDKLLPRGETRFSFALRVPDPTEEGEFDVLSHDGRGIWAMIENLPGGRI